MKKLLASALALVMLAAPAVASAQSAIAYTDQLNNHPVTVGVTPSKPLPVTGSFSATTTAKANAADPSLSEGSTTNQISVDLSGYLRSKVKAASGAFVDGWDATQGTQADAAWSGTGNGTQVAIQKAIRNLLAGSLTVTTAAASVTPCATATTSCTDSQRLAKIEQGIEDTTTVTPVKFDHTTPGDTDGAQLRAGEAHAGEVGGNQLTIQVAQTVTASSAYASGNAVGGLITLSNAARVAAGSGLIQSVVINSKSAQTAQIDVIFFNANPTASTCTDKTAFSVAAADFDKVLGHATIAATTGWTSLGTPSVGEAQNLAMPFSMASGSTLYACAVSRGTPTFTATTDISIGVRVIRN